MGRLPNIRGASVLDLGCGTGVLGLAALKLGARSVVALDVDPDAVRTARANAALNSAADRFRVALGGIGALGKVRFDLILANLYGDLLLSRVDSVVSHLKPGGSIVLSGIRWEDRFELTKVLEERGLTIQDILVLEGYVTLRAGRTDSAGRGPAL